MIVLVVLLLILCVGEGAVILKQVKQPQRSLTSVASGMVCPYDGVALTGDRELDQLTHMGCVTKARFTLEQLWQDQIAQHVQAALPPAVEWNHSVRQDRTSAPLAYHWSWSVLRGSRVVAKGEAPYMSRAKRRGEEVMQDLRRREGT